MGLRRNARELALQMLYARDFAATASAAGATGPISDPFWTKVQPEAQAFAARLNEGVGHHRPEIDTLIRQYAEHWSLERMSGIDRAILRFAIFEMLHLPETPRRVVMNEAIEIARKYGNENSSAFVNGILDRIHQQHPEPKSAPTENALHPLTLTPA